jgi:hypothetical protein
MGSVTFPTTFQLLGEQKNLFLDLAAAVFSDPFAVKKA